VQPATGRIGGRFCAVEGEEKKKMARTTYFNVRVLAVVAALALAACLLALVVRMEPSQAAFPGQNGKIAFDRFEGDCLQIFTMNADGSNQTKISNNSGCAFQPAWSPDGTKIAFSSFAGGTNEIWTMNADGSNETKITSTGASQFPAWSPDGTKIAFMSFSGRTNDIYTINVDGSNQTNLTDNSVPDAHPAWSPDGTKIAFTSSNDIYVMTADGSNQTNVSNNPGDDNSPDWSPDGTKLIFQSQRDNNPEIYVMDADGSNQTRLTNSAVSETPGSFSPDGTKIVFTSNRDGFREIYTMNTDGCNQTNISNNAAGGGAPDWQPITASTNTAPTITCLRPAPGSTTTNRTPTISATVTDDQTNLALSNITLTLDGATIPRTAYSYNQSTDTMSYTPQKKLMLGQHTVKVDAQDGSGLSTTQSWSFTTANTDANGLKGEYYDNQDLTNLKLTRTDPKVDFSWGTGSPDSSIAPDTFSVRWSGQVKADHTQTYTFYASTNDGVRLWVGGQQIINRWSDGIATNTGTVSLQAGQWYPITMEYYEGVNSASAKLEYSSPSTPRQVIPSSKLSPTAP
jgi:Tol biopolymer transport system component